VKWSTADFIAYFFTLDDIKMIESAGREKRNRSNKKLTRVLSTKLTIEDYDRFQKHTNDAYKSGAISKPSGSEFLRYIVIHRSNKPSILDLVADTNSNC
jgi:hypothetical protein